MKPTVESGSKSEITVKNNILPVCGEYKEAVMVAACGACARQWQKKAERWKNLLQEIAEEKKNSVKKFNGPAKLKELRV